MRQTSLLAFNLLRERQVLSSRRREVLDMIFNLGSATDQEIRLALGVADPNYVRPRRFELEKTGLIFNHGKRACKVTGRVAMVWEIAT